MNGTLNKVILIGHLGDEVKMRYFEGGNSLGQFPLATNEVYTNKEGERVKITEWHNIVVRNKLAELCEKYLVKGDKIYCEGRIKNRQWTGQDGQTRYTTEIHVRDIVFLSNKKMENRSENISGQTKQSDSSPPESKLRPGDTPPNEGNNDDDLPF
jgi:single-strand DNA-binding protein